MKNEYKEARYDVWCITKDGREIRLGNGEPMTEKEADCFAAAHIGGVGTAAGNRYVVRPVQSVYASTF